MDSGKNYRSKFDELMIPNYNPSTLIAERAKGAKVYDVDGNEYLDLSGGIAVNALGHCPDVLVDALKEQVEKLWHISNVHTNKNAIDLAKKFCELTFADRIFYCNSGAEANEAALKLARKYSIGKFGEEKHKIISFEQSFHGRTFFTVSVGGQKKYYQGFGPVPGGIEHIPYNDESALEKIMGPDVAAVIVEPVQGEGGINPGKLSFLKKIRQLCDQHNAVMIMDEIQTGVGRSGYLYQYEESGVVPDILTTAKGIAGGFPFAAVLAKDSIAKGFSPGDHGSTYGGNPMGCYLALKVLETVANPNFLKNVKELGLHLRGRLEELLAKYPYFTEVRGTGLLLGMGLSKKWCGKAKTFRTIGIKEGLIILQAGVDTLRFAPSLNITKEEIEEGLKRFEKVLNSKELI